MAISLRLGWRWITFARRAHRSPDSGSFVIMTTAYLNVVTTSYPLLHTMYEYSGAYEQLAIHTVYSIDLHVIPHIV